MKLPLSRFAERETERMLRETMRRNNFITMAIRQRRKNKFIQEKGIGKDILVCPVFMVYKGVTA